MPWTVWHFSALFLAVGCFLLPYFQLRRKQRGPFHGSVDAAVKTRTVSIIPASKKVKQPYDAFLVLDVEATCEQGTTFDYPNEIIEFPVCLMRWKDRDGGTASKLETVAEFRSFVKPSWRSNLSKFCTELTGITQDQVDAAPDFPAMLRFFRAFLVEHKLIEKSGKRRLRFCWCSDGPFDIRDFVVKQCFISQIPFPDWMTGDVLDVRGPSDDSHVEKTHFGNTASARPVYQNSDIEYPGGIDDTRNLARIMTQLALEGVCLKPNTVINLRRRWVWMGRSGQILEEYLTC
ncbi:3'-5' exonuclease eri1 [Mycena venus]|uniref:3'-5' exonuclease eri1 n=1 Tax=Mycena venus TaxID=2733690 RepID=A0A8H6XD11_9AGAR|nr:3'-5' exonuclease eri1 [Mycena venus]